MMQELKKELRSRLSGASKIAVLGIGSELKGDDACGVLIARDLEEAFSKNPPKRDLKIFIGGTAPENLTGEIKRFKPSHIIIIDSADIGRSPGEAALINPEEIGGLSLSTHNLPAKMLIDYLLQFIKCDVIILGIQPKSVRFGESLSREVAGAVDLVSGLIRSVILE